MNMQVFEGNIRLNGSGPSKMMSIPVNAAALFRDLSGITSPILKRERYVTSLGNLGLSRAHHGGRNVVSNLSNITSLPLGPIKYTIEKRNEVVDIFPFEGRVKTLAEQLADERQKRAEAETKLASLVKVEASVRKMEHDEHNLVSDFTNWLLQRGAGSIKEHKRTDNLFVWNKKVYLGEAKFIKKGGQTEGQAVDNSLKVQRYAEIDFASDNPNKFVLFNQPIASKYIPFFNSKGIAVIVKIQDIYVLQGNAFGLESLFNGSN